MIRTIILAAALLAAACAPCLDPPARGGTVGPIHTHPPPVERPAEQ